MTVCACALIVHIASTYSAVARVIMATSAMGAIPILPKEEEEKLLPIQLFDVLIAETQVAYAANVPVNSQYRMNYQEHIRTTGHSTRSSTSSPGTRRDETSTYRQLFKRRHPDVELGPPGDLKTSGG
jgi:hypothetical protein